MDEHVVRALPVIIQAYMTSLGRLYASTRASGRMDGVRMARLQEIKTRARALMMFTANAQFKLPSDVYGAIVRVEADMI